MTGMNMLSHKQQLLLYIHFSLTVLHVIGYPLESWSPSVHPSITNLLYSVKHTICTHMLMHICVCVPMGSVLATMRFAALDSQSSAKRTHTITTLLQFICHGSLTSFNCQA